MDPFDPHRPPRTVGEKIIYAIGGIAGMAALIGVAAMITSMVVKKDDPATDPSTSASPVALITTPPTASSQPSSMPSEKPYGVFDPSEFTVTYSTAPAKDANCGLAEGPLIVPQTIPKPSWDRVDDAILLPSNPETGPTKQTGPVRHCYAKSGAGLVYAGANHLFQSLIYEEFQTDEAQAITTLESFRTQYAQAGAKKNDGGKRSDMAKRGLKEGKPIGWDILTIDNETNSAEVLIYGQTIFEDGREGFVRSYIPLTWDKGDWRVSGHIQTDPAQGEFTGMRKFE